MPDYIETPENTDAQVPENTEAQITETTDAQVPENTEAQITETTDVQVPETASTLVAENKDAQSEEDEVCEDIFIRKTVEENIYNSRGCAHAPNLEESASEVHQQMSCCAQMHSYNWSNIFEDLSSTDPFDLVEIRFKNTHKEFFKLPEEKPEEYQCGDIVAVEGTPGHNMGIICLRGELARKQAINKNIDVNSPTLKKVYRKARQIDVDKWIEIIQIEKETQRRARIIAAELGLGMKINNVEYQGDFTKAIFYYTADDRVDFRQLIKLYADEFKVRIEMKQIGARQEAGNIGGIGSCGRELCCVTFLHNFTSVSTNAARVQQISLNPQKLAGQCSKLKCCLNFEYDTYTDMQKSMPDTRITIETEQGTAQCVKTDILKQKMSYAYLDAPRELYEIDVEVAQRLIEANKRGEKPFDFPSQKEEIEKVDPVEFSNVVGQDELTRFDKQGKQGDRQDRQDRQDDRHRHGKKNKKYSSSDNTDKKTVKKSVGMPILQPKEKQNENNQ